MPLHCLSRWSVAIWWMLSVRNDPRRPNQLENVLFHQDNAPPHVAASTQLEISLLGFEQITLAPYSPDLAPMDFALLPCIKADLKGLRFSDSERTEASNITCCEETWRLLVPRSIQQMGTSSWKLCCDGRNIFWKEVILIKLAESRNLTSRVISWRQKV